jgi:DNA repair photolyase
MDLRGDAGMPMAVVVLPILPDMEENWRRFAQDLLEDHLDEYEALRRHVDIRRVTVYLARMPRWDVILAHVEAENPEEAFRRLVASEEPFAEWFKEKLAELTGYELRGRRVGASPELIFEHPAASGGS